MRKFVLTAAVVLVFAIGVFAGLSTTTTTADAANCYYTCTCNGTPLKCCVTIYGTACKKDTSGTFQCPQRYDC